MLDLLMIAVGAGLTVFGIIMFHTAASDWKVSDGPTRAIVVGLIFILIAGGARCMGVL